MAKKKIEELDENELLYKLLSKKVGAIDPYKVLYVEPSKGIIHLGGKNLPANQQRTLKAEAGAIRQTNLYKLLIATLENTAHHYMFKEMKTLEDQHYGKTMLYNISVINKIIESLANIPEQKLSTVPKM